VTFVEVLMAMGILAGILAPLLYFMGVTHQSNRGSTSMVMASNLATEVMEAVQALPVDVLAPIDGSTPGTQAGDLIQNGVMQPSFYDQVFGAAVARGYLVNIPPFPKGWDANLIISPVEVPINIPAGGSDGQRALAERARQMITITVRVSWKEYGVARSIHLATTRGRL